MNSRIADNLHRQPRQTDWEEQKAAKTTTFDLQLNPATPRMSFYKLDKAWDKHFVSLWMSSGLWTECSFRMELVIHLFGIGDEAIKVSKHLQQGYTNVSYE